MHTTTPLKSNKMFINLPSRAESLRKVRKASIPESRAMRDERNDYRRRPKHRGQSWDSED